MTKYYEYLNKLTLVDILVPSSKRSDLLFTLRLLGFAKMSTAEFISSGGSRAKGPEGDRGGGWGGGGETGREERRAKICHRGVYL